MICFLIDDDPDDQEFFAMALEEVDKNVKLVTASSGPEAIEKLQPGEFRPDVIFLDINMPRMDGWECLGEIRRLRGMMDTPVVMYSTSDISSASSSRKDYMAFLTKQVKIGNLVSRLRDLFGKL